MKFVALKSALVASLLMTVAVAAPVIVLAQYLEVKSEHLPA